MSVTPSTQSAPTLLDISADNWRLAILVGLVVSILAVATLPASISFWIVGAMAGCT
jgi:multiple sugar transport system permease protein